MKVNDRLSLTDYKLIINVLLLNLVGLCNLLCINAQMHCIIVHDLLIRMEI